MSNAVSPLWNLATDYVLEKIKNGDFDRYGNYVIEGSWDYVGYRPTEITPVEMRQYVEQSKAGTLPGPMCW